MENYASRNFYVFNVEGCDSLRFNTETHADAFGEARTLRSSPRVQGQIEVSRSLRSGLKINRASCAPSFWRASSYCDSMLLICLLCNVVCYCVSLHCWSTDVSDSGRRCFQAGECASHPEAGKRRMRDFFTTGGESLRRRW